MFEKLAIKESPNTPKQQGQNLAKAPENKIQNVRETTTKLLEAQLAEVLYEIIEE